MKKVFSALAFMLMIYSSNSFAQSNLNWVLKEKADDAYFKRSEFIFSFSGLSNPKDMTAFYAKLKANTDVSSVQEKGKDADGNYSFLIQMKAPQAKNYYLNWATKLGVAYIVNLKGDKKTPQQMLAPAEKGVLGSEQTH